MAGSIDFGDCTVGRHSENDKGEQTNGMKSKSKMIHLEMVSSLAFLWILKGQESMINYKC